MVLSKTKRNVAALQRDLNRLSRENSELFARLYIAEAETKLLKSRFASLQEWFFELRKDILADKKLRRE